MSKAWYIIGSVIATLIAAFLLWLGPTVWEYLKAAGLKLLDFFSASISLPVWLFIILLFYLAFVTLILGRRFYLDLWKKPTWRDYKEDCFAKMRWIWRYHPVLDEIEDLWCFCPNDSNRLICSPEYPGISFHCEFCGKKFGPTQETLQEIIDRVERQIERKKRSGDWRKVVEGRH